MISKYIVIAALLFNWPTLLMAQSPAEIKFEEGYAKYENEDYEGAIASYTLAIQLNSVNPEYYFHRGVCYSTLSQDHEAISNFDKAISLDENYAEAYFERAYSYYLLDDPDRALADYGKAIAHNPDNGEAYMNRGTVKFAKYDQEGACSDWNKAVALGITVAETLITEFCK